MMIRVSIFIDFFLLFSFKSNTDTNNNTNYECDVYVDGANGVGAIKVNQLVNTLNKLNIDNKKSTIKLHVFNDGSSNDAKLNYLVS